MKAGIISLILVGMAGLWALDAEAQQRPVPRSDRATPATAGAAQPDAAQPGVTAASGEVAVLRGLDKIAGTTTEYTLRPGESVRFGRLDVVLGECRYPVEDPDSDAFAQLTISDLSAGRIVFSGWMIASSPALSALDDARYDLWVVSCQRVSASGIGPDSSAGTDSAAESLR